jgi:kynureninase
MNFINSEAFALQLDEQDELKAFKNEFIIPKHQGKEVIYFTGNSLGLQPKITQSYIQQELEDWAQFAVEGHFKAKRPWYSYHEFLTEKSAQIVGAKNTEVVCMNQLTVNLHLLLVSFYRPSKNRYKILCETKAFPSDQYALESQVAFHGYKPEDAIIELIPRPGEYAIRLQDILDTIEKHKNELSLVMMGGVNYYTGQVFNMQAITQAAHKAGAYAGYDLAHAAGNIKLELHNWNVDFACWCSYKYLNSGPGSVSGVFIHENHHRANLPRFAGWWGYDKNTRFKMQKGFVPIPTAEAWQLSNAGVFSMAPHLASLTIFEKAGMEKLTSKSQLLTAYLEFIIQETNQYLKQINSPTYLKIITPKNNDEVINYPSSINRGAQLSIIAENMGKELFNKLTDKGVVADWREPNVIRMAPVPLYNSFKNIFDFGQLLKEILS